MTILLGASESLKFYERKYYSKNPVKLDPPKNFLDRVAIFSAKFLIFCVIALNIVIEFKLIILFLIAMVTAWGLAFLLQIIFRHPRPFQEGQRPLIKMLFETPSFPSAHTAIVFSILPLNVLWGENLRHPGFVILFTFFAILIAWSRVRVRVHHVSDVVAGAVVGIIAALLSPFILGAAVGVYAVFSFIAESYGRT